MAKIRKKRLIALVGVVVFVGSAFFAFSIVTQQKRDAAIARLRVRLATAMESSNGQSPPGLGLREQDKASSRDGSPSSPVNTISAYSDLFKTLDSIEREPVADHWREDHGGTPFFWASSMSPLQWTQKERDCVVEFLLVHQDFLTRIRSVSTLGGPVGQLDYSQSYSMDLQHAAHLRTCAHLLAAEAAVRAGEENYAGAVEDIVAAMRLADALANEEVVACQMVRMVLYRWICNIVEAYIPGEKLSPEEFGLLMEHLSKASRHDAFVKAYNGEMRMLLDLFDSVRKGDPNPQLGILRFDDRMRWSAIGCMARVYRSRVARSLVDMDEIYYINSMVTLLGAAPLQYYKALPTYEYARERSRTVPYPLVASRTILACRTWEAEDQAQHEARVGLMQIGLAVEQYHARGGEYPLSLEAVAPLMSGALPVDPFTGQSFVYNASGDGFVLYSARGSVPDLGVPTSNRKPPSDMDEHGNIVWRGGRARPATSADSGRRSD